MCPDVLVLTESWLNDSIADSEVTIKGYNQFRIDRTSRGGGVTVYVKSCVNVSKPVSKPKCFEYIALEIQLRHFSLVLVFVYRPPSAELESINTLANLISCFYNSEMLFFGDFNLK